MTTEKRNRKTVKGIRFTEEELESIKKEMQAFDYLSFSKFIRDTVLHKTKYKSRGKVKDRELLGRIDELSKKVERIGHNYNQLIKSYNTLHQARALTIPIVDEHIQQLEELTRRVYNIQLDVIKQIDEFATEKKTE